MQKSLLVNEFLGVDRNRVQGQADGVLAPTRLFNLVPDRRGGYVPFGRRVSKAVTLTNLDRLVGYDEGGLFTMTTTASGAGELVLNKGVTPHTQDVPSYPDVENAAHLALTGSYISRDRFLVLNREDIKAQPVKLAVEANPISASVAGVLTIGATRINDVAFGGSAGNELWILVNEAGEVYRSTDGTGRDWETEPVFTASGKLGGVAYGNGRWIVVGGDATPLIYYADDTATDTWTAATHPGADQGFDKVAFDIGTLSNGSTFIASGNEIFRSTDNGSSWVEVDDTHDGFANNWRTGPIAIHANDYITVIIEGDYRGGVIDGSEVTMVSTDGITWNGSGLPPWDAVFDIAVSTDGIFVAVTESGEVWSSSDPSAFASWVKHADNIMGSGKAVRAVCFNADTDSWFIAGYSGTVMESANLAAWTPVEFNEDVSETLYAIGAASDGTVVAAGDDGRVMVGYGTSGLPVGTYEVVTIAYFNTRAGKFVFDISTHEVSFPDRGDNTISITAPTKEKVAADTLADASYGYTPASGILDDIHIDVFLKYDPNAVGNTDEVEETYSEIVNEPVIVYDFTAALDSGAVDATSEIGVIEETPLGSQLGGGQGVTTIVYEQPETALHAGRMWGMAAQVQDRYPSDDVSLEIANVFGDFVLSYTEPGWTNLIRPDNYLPLRPTQSTAFTGILSTPAGVMVFFDNEVFVVDGDAALGNLQFGLYPDIVGNDEGATPCKLGGVPFCVWKGKIYALVGGRVEDVSGPVFRQDDKFIQIAPEPQERSLLALTESGGVWRYDFTRQFWSNNVVSDDVVQLLPNCNCVVGDNTLYADAAGALYVARRDGTPDTPSVTYRGIDFGNSRKRKAVYRVSVPVEQMNPVGGELAPVPDPGGSATIWPTSSGSGQPYSYQMAADWGGDTVDGQELARTVLFDPATWDGLRPIDASSPRHDAEGGAYVDYGDYFVALDYMVARGYDGSFVWDWERDHNQMIFTHALATESYIFMLLSEFVPEEYKVIVLDPATGLRIAESPTWTTGWTMDDMRLLGDGRTVIIPGPSLNEEGWIVTFDFETGVHTTTPSGIDNTNNTDIRGHAVSADGLYYYTVHDGSLVASNPVHIYKYDNNHALVWTSVYAITGGMGGIIELADGNVLIADATDPGPTFVKIDGATGATLDTVVGAETGDFPPPRPGTGPLLSNGVAVMASEFNSYLYFFDTITWSIVGFVRTEGGFSNTPKATTGDIVWYQNRVDGGPGGDPTLGAYDSTGTLIKMLASAASDSAGSSLEYIDFRLPYADGVIGFSTNVNAICKWEF